MSLCHLFKGIRSVNLTYSRHDMTENVSTTLPTNEITTHDQKVEIKLYGHLQKFSSGAMGLYKTWFK